MSMVNQMFKFSPNVSRISKPVRELPSSKTERLQYTEMYSISQKKTSPGVLALCNIKANIKVRADTSGCGFGAVLLLLQQEFCQPVAFASRVLETCYVQTEKEALTLTWELEKFADYVVSHWKQITTATGTTAGYQKSGLTASTNTSI